MTTDKQPVRELFQFDGRPRIQEIIPMSLQHLFAMIVGNITPALIVSGRAGLEQADRVILVQASLFMAALATLIMVFSIKGFFGARLPVILGVSFSYLPTLAMITDNFGGDISYIFGAQIAGAVLAILFGFGLKYLVKLFPQIVTGTVVLTIGLTLYPIAVNYMAGGVGSPEYGSLKNWLVALFTLLVVIIANNWGKGMVKLASVLIGMIAGYLLALALGMVNFANIGQSEMVALLRVMHFGIKFELSTIIAMLIMFMVNSVQAIGDLSATTAGGMGRIPSERELSQGIMGYGLVNLLGAVFNCLPTATYSQNVGLVGTTKVINKFVFAGTAVILLIASFIPKFGALLTTVPAAVLGGATITVFGSITMTGMRLITEKPLSRRNAGIVGLAVALGLGITLVPASIAAAPQWFKTIFGSNAVVIATLVAISLNLILPMDPGDEALAQR